jgi:2-methylcitrate dehydratase PrpD
MCEEPRPELILADLGERFALIESGFKVHSTCGMLFNLLDGLLEAREEHGLAGDLPSRVRVGVPSWIVTDQAFSRRRPTSPGQARFSIPFAVAAALIDGEVSPRQMTDDKLADPAYAELEGIVEISEDEEVEAIFQATRRDPFFFYPAAVEIERDGQVYRSVHRNPKGYDTNRPLTRDEVMRKFVSSASLMLGEDGAESLMQQAVAFDGDASVSGLMSALVSAPAEAVTVRND